MNLNRFLIGFAILTLSTFSFAQTHTTAKSNALSESKKLPEDFKKMFDQFKEAILSKNKTKASQLSKFPLKNIVYEAPPTQSQKEFEASVKEGLFGFCYDVLPEKDAKTAEWVLDCDGNVFYFGKVKDQWKYVGYENINE